MYTLVKKFLAPSKDLIFLRTQVRLIASVGGATVFNNLLAFIINVVAARNLGVEGFGVFSLALSVAAMVSVVGDVGLNLSMIRLFNKYYENGEKRLHVLSAALFFKILIFVNIVIIGLLAGEQFAHLSFLQEGYGRLWSIAFFTGGLLLLWTYLQAYLQAYRAFNLLALFILVYAIFRLLCLYMAYHFFPQNPKAWLVTIYTFPLIALVLIGMVAKANIVICDVVKNPRRQLLILKELLHYSKWVALSGIAYTAMPYVIRFILATRASVAEVGIFSAGMTFTVAFTTLNTAIRVVLFPQVTAFDSFQIRRYLARLRQIAPYYLLLSILGIGGLGGLQWIFLGKEYYVSLFVFGIVAFTQVISLFISAITMLLHTAMRPDIDAKVDMTRIFLLVVLGYWIAPIFGAVGCAFIYGGLGISGALTKLVILQRNFEGFFGD